MTATDTTPTRSSRTRPVRRSLLDRLRDGDVRAAVTFAGLIAVICLYEGGIVALLVAITIGLVGGLLNKLFHMHTGVQFMGYYVATLTVPAVTALLA